MTDIPDESTTVTIKETDTTEKVEEEQVPVVSPKQEQNSKDQDADEEIHDDPDLQPVTITITAKPKKSNSKPIINVVEDELIDDDPDLVQNVPIEKANEKPAKPKKSKSKPKINVVEDELIDDDPELVQNVPLKQANEKAAKPKKSNSKPIINVVEDELIDDDPELVQSVPINSPTEKKQNQKKNKNKKNKQQKNQQNQKPADTNDDDEELLDDPDLTTTIKITSGNPAQNKSPKDKFKPYFPEKATNQQPVKNEKPQTKTIGRSNSTGKIKPDIKPNQKQGNFKAQVNSGPERSSSFNNTKYNNNYNNYNNNNNRPNHQKQNRPYSPKQTGTTDSQIKSLLDQYMAKPSQTPKFEDTGDIPRFYEVPLITDSKPIKEFKPEEKEVFPEQPKFARVNNNNKKKDLQKARDEVQQETPEKTATKGAVLDTQVEVKPLVIPSFASKLGIKGFSAPAEKPKEEVKMGGLTFSFNKPRNNQENNTVDLTKPAPIVITSSSKIGKGFVKEVEEENPLEVLGATTTPEEEPAEPILNNVEEEKPKQCIIKISAEPENNVENKEQAAEPLENVSPIPQEEQQEEDNTMQQIPQQENNVEQPSEDKTILINKQQSIPIKTNPFVIKTNNFDSSDDDNHFGFDDDDDEDRHIEDKKFLNDIMGIHDENEGFNEQPEEVKMIPSSNLEEEEEEGDLIPQPDNEQVIVELNPSQIETGELPKIEEQPEEEPKQPTEEQKPEEVPVEETKPEETPVKEPVSEEKPVEEPVPEEPVKPEQKVVTPEEEDIIIPQTPSKPQQGSSNILVAGVIFLAVIILFRVMFK